MDHYNDIARGVVDPFLRAVGDPWGRDLSDVPRMLVVMSGLPGCHKTTLAETIVENAGAMGAESTICSANHCFMHDGVFEFNVNDLGHAQDACLNQCLDGLRQPRDLGSDIIIVDNTNLCTEDFELYTKLPCDPDWLEVITFECPHNDQDAQQLPTRVRAYDTGPQVGEVASHLARKLHRPAEP